MSYLPGIIAFLRSQPLIALAVGAMVLSFVGGMFPHRALAGRMLRGVGTLGLVAVFGLTVVQVARLDGNFDLSLPGAGLPAQQVSGGETRVPLRRDGHYWVTAKVNGTPLRFMVDTGATLTALSPEAAAQAGLRDAAMRQPVILRTANGPVEAKIATIGEMRFGNVVARDLDAVIAPGIGDTNVIGMNFLSRLKGWRVEDGTMILSPHHPQAGSGR
ncbi:retropepsin-like aspartic protease family protein [Parablastomonas sp. CN1-191]|uniref:retropepsin-like aspartic protease family protein n=1 Tax=Parablastomonas sp. CN1-191 TaxID=3400908 RepID=UPI003BF887B7